MLNNNLNGFSFGITADGKPGYRKPGADAVTPFSGNFTLKLTATVSAYQSSTKRISSDTTIIIECKNNVFTIKGTPFLTYWGGPTGYGAELSALSMQEFEVG